MRKIIIFGLSIIVIFSALIFATSYQKKQQLADNPYGKEDLHPETINQLDDELYQNVILPEELEEKLVSGESVTVYFYSPLCDVCTVASPRIISKAEELDVNVYLYNVLEFNEGFRQYELQGTPTVIHYNDGKEIERVSGLHEEKSYRSFYEEVVLKN